MAKLKHYTRYMIDIHLQRMKKQSKSRYVEVGITVALLFIAMLLSTLITPHNPRLEVTDSTYQSDEQVESKYYRAKIDNVTRESVTATLLDGPGKGEEVTVDYPSVVSSREGTANILSYDVGETVLLSSTTADSALSVVDHYRIPMLVGVLFVFMCSVLIVGGRQGMGSIVGLGVTIVVVGWFIIPFLAEGYNPLLICIVGAYLIAFASITIAHGFKRRTFISVACVAILLTIIALMTMAAVQIMNFTGLADEAAALFVNEKPHIDMRGLLAGGIIIASLGVLDDIVTAQVATVDELQKANPKLGKMELFSRASSVGKEHVSALVNTLALVYVGAALPMIVMLSQNTDTLIFINSEFMAVEITRTLVASIGLVLAVPLSTAIAAVYLHRYYVRRHMHPTSS